MTAPPDRHGLLSLGVEVLASQTASECARRVIVQINERMPRVLGNSFVHIDDVDVIVEVDERLNELDPTSPTEVERGSPSRSSSSCRKARPCSSASVAFPRP